MPDSLSMGWEAGDTKSLFGPLPLLAWLPDETLFSLVSRNHVLGGFQSDWKTSVALFGSRHAGSQHDLPNRLDEFVRRTQGLLGSAEAIALKHTLLSYYRNFLPESDERSVIGTLRSGSVAHLKLKLGLLTSRFRANHPLKACTACMAHDLAAHGWAYWHLVHQFPGIWVCPEHHLPLRESLFKSTGVGRFLWHLPVAESLRPWSDKDFECFQTYQATLASLAQTTQALTLPAGATRIDTRRLSEVYRTELEKRNWITREGSLRLNKIAPDFLAHTEKLRFLPELHALPTTQLAAAAQVGRLLRQERSGTHPIRHLILIDWLFGGGEAFMEVYRARAISPSPFSTIETLPLLQNMSLPDRDAHIAQLVQLLEAERMSMRGAAKVLGIDIGTAMAWAAQRGIKISRRPKILKADQRAALISDLRQGLRKREAAERYRISIVTVTAVLRTEEGLQRSWHDALFAQAKEDARAAWSLLLIEQGALGVKFMRSLKPAAYAWLYRNDREWLEQHLPLKANRPNPGNPTVRWDERDLALSSVVEKAALALSSLARATPIYLWHLYQQVPELKAKLSALDRLPLTRRAIERAVGKSGTGSAANDLLS